MKTRNAECYSSSRSETNSTRLFASRFETFRPAGTLSTRTVVSRSRRRTVILSPRFTTWADFARRLFNKTKPASQSCCATVRRGQRRLSLRKRSRRMVAAKSQMRGAKSGAFDLQPSCSFAVAYGFGKIPRILPLPFCFFESLRTAAVGGTIFRSGSTLSL